MEHVNYYGVRMTYEHRVEYVNYHDVSSTYKDGVECELS